MQTDNPTPEAAMVEECTHDAFEVDNANQPVRCVDCGTSISTGLAAIQSAPPPVAGDGALRAKLAQSGIAAMRAVAQDAERFPSNEIGLARAGDHFAELFLAAPATGGTFADGAKVGDGTPDAALAIGEHAFRAGWHAHARFSLGLENDLGELGMSPQGAAAQERAWDAYDPPEHIKDLS